MRLEAGGVNLEALSLSPGFNRGGLCGRLIPLEELPNYHSSPG